MLVRPWTDPVITGQSSFNKRECCDVAGRIAQRDDDGNIADKWIFEKIIDIHDKDIEKNGLTYLIKWKYNNEPSWQPELDLEGCENALQNFHRKNPHKPGRPAWVKMALKPPRNPRRQLR